MAGTTENTINIIFNPNDLNFYLESDIENPIYIYDSTHNIYTDSDNEVKIDTSVILDLFIQNYSILTDEDDSTKLVIQNMMATLSKGEIVTESEDTSNNMGIVYYNFDDTSIPEKSFYIFTGGVDEEGNSIKEVIYIYNETLNVYLDTNDTQMSASFIRELFDSIIERTSGDEKIAILIAQRDSVYEFDLNEDEETTVITYTYDYSNGNITCKTTVGSNPSSSVIWKYNEEKNKYLIGDSETEIESSKIIAALFAILQDIEDSTLTTTEKAVNKEKVTTQLNTYFKSEEDFTTTVNNSLKATYLNSETLDLIQNTVIPYLKKYNDNKSNSIILKNLLSAAATMTVNFGDLSYTFKKNPLSGTAETDDNLEIFSAEDNEGISHSRTNSNYYYKILETLELYLLRKLNVQENSIISTFFDDSNYKFDPTSTDIETLDTLIDNFNIETLTDYEVDEDTAEITRTDIGIDEHTVICNTSNFYKNIFINSTTDTTGTTTSKVSDYRKALIEYCKFYKLVISQSFDITVTIIDTNEESYSFTFAISDIENSTENYNYINEENMFAKIWKILENSFNFYQTYYKQQLNNYNYNFNEEGE